jgi:hypothetical protein
VLPYDAIVEIRAIGSSVVNGIVSAPKWLFLLAAIGTGIAWIGSRVRASGQRSTKRKLPGLIARLRLSILPLAMRRGLTTIGPLAIHQNPERHVFDPEASSRLGCGKPTVSARITFGSNRFELYL